MNKCQSMLINVALTTFTSILECSMSENKSEIPNIVGRRIKINKTIESVIGCVAQSDCDCHSK